MLQKKLGQTRRRSSQIAIGTLLTLLVPGTAALAAPPDGAKIYREACAACHGPSGEGVAPGTALYENFRTPPADLTDPLFNSREPRADWLMVIKHGGSAMGLSSQMPAYEHALTEEEILVLTDYLKTLAGNEDYPSGDLNFPRPIQTIKAFPEDEALLLYRQTRLEGEGPDTHRATAYFARRIGRRLQWEVKASHLDNGERSELSDLELGLKWAFFDDLKRSLLLAVGAEVEIPVQDSDQPEVFIPYLSLAKGLTEKLTFQGTLRSHLPTDDLDHGDFAASGILHYQPSPWPRSFIPGLEGTVTVPFDGDKDVAATIIPQLYAGLSKRGHVALTVGAELPITDLDYDVRIRAFLLWDIADGPFWQGWR